MLALCTLTYYLFFKFADGPLALQGNIYVALLLNTIDFQCLLSSLWNNDHKPLIWSDLLSSPFLPKVSRLVYFSSRLPDVLLLNPYHNKTLCWCKSVSFSRIRPSLARHFTQLWYLASWRSLYLQSFLKNLQSYLSWTPCGLQVKVLQHRQCLSSPHTKPQCCTLISLVYKYDLYCSYGFI